MQTPDNKTTSSVNRLLKYSIIPIFILFSACGVSDSNDSSGTSINLPSNPTSTKDADWLIPVNEIVDGGPGKDGIPSIDNPNFAPVGDIDFVQDSRMIVGVKIDDEVRAYPHQVLDWHEIVNHQIDSRRFAIIYCPLTGTGVCWDDVESEFGVSGLLFRNNLIAYDRNTDSNWSQMQLRSVNGVLSGRDISEPCQVVETTWETWKKVYPESLVLTINTGFQRDYQGFAYGRNYLNENSGTLFPIQNRDDRLPTKKRVHGIIGSDAVNMEAEVKVYVIDEFGEGVKLIDDYVDGNQYIIAGSTEYNFATAFQLFPGIGASLKFEAVQNQLPVIMQDNEGNLWDIFGHAVDGPRQGDRLTAARSYTGYWFAWADFFPGLDIYEDAQEE